MILIVMGVCGCGKTTIGELIAERLQWNFTEGDQHHSKSNVEKMTNGTPLTDTDRRPWLETLHGVAQGWTDESQNGVITCSALKRKYRNILRSGSENTSERPPSDVVFVHLTGDPALISNRMKDREHFMPTLLIESQFADLEPPGDDEPHIGLCISQPLESIVEDSLTFIRSRIDKPR